MAKKTAEKNEQNKQRLRAKEYSADIIRRAEKIINGIDTEYDPLLHIPLLLSSFKLGKDIAAFCDEADINRDTFFVWIKNFHDFSRAYSRARELSRAWFENVGQTGITNPLEFNAVAWSMQMRNRFGYTDKRKVKIDKFDELQSHLSRVNLIYKELSRGEITVDEARTLMDIIMSSVHIEEATTLKSDMEWMKEQLKGQL